MFGLKEPYLFIKVIFVGFSSVLWLVLGFGFWLEISGERGKPTISTEIAVEYRY